MVAVPNTTLAGEAADPHPVEPGEAPELDGGDDPEQHQAAGQRPERPRVVDRQADRGRGDLDRHGAADRHVVAPRQHHCFRPFVPGPLRVAEGLGVASTFHIGKYA